MRSLKYLAICHIFIFKIAGYAILVFMKNLYIYPTSRALRVVSAQFKEQDSFLPTLMRMDEFEKRAMLFENKIQIDPMERILLLREAASFEDTNDLNLHSGLVHFFTRSDAVFKFFEELAAERIDFNTLGRADAYAEFELHLQILQTILNNYKDLLDQRNLIDKAFIPEQYTINTGFVQTYECIEIYLEGYLSHFEFNLIDKVSQATKVLFHYTTSKFTVKMQERFEAYGIHLPDDSHVIIDFSTKKILSATAAKDKIEAEVIGVEERHEQIAFAFTKIEEMVRAGIDPEKIALILPDEQLKESIALYDRLGNFNFAMGYDYSKQKNYKMLAALYAYWQNFEKEQWLLLKYYGMETQNLQDVNPNKKVKADDFFILLDQSKLLDCPLMPILQAENEKKPKYNEKAYEAYLHFTKVFSIHVLSIKEWLFLWMKALDTITIDDVRGGKITVMGVLETRGVSFEGIVIVDFNEGIVPASSSKDQFLNSAVRAFAGLPTKNDREALQKQYYKRLLEQANQAVILYCSSDNKLPSKFLFELGLYDTQQRSGQLDIFYGESSGLVLSFEDPVVESFDAFSFTWSASRLKTYLECKRKYYYKYIQKIEAKKDEELNEGAFLHTLLEHVYAKNDTFATVEALEKRLHKSLDELLPHEDAKTAYQKLLWKEKLKGFIQTEVRYFNDCWKVVAREIEIKGKIGGLDFKGRIDRIDQNATDTWILDYKSGSTAEANKVKNLETLNDFQMSIYHYLLGPRYQNIKLSYVKILENGQREDIEALDEKNARLAEHIVNLKQSRHFVAKKCEDLQKCNYCEFALTCERGPYL